MVTKKTSNVDIDDLNKDGFFDLSKKMVLLEEGITSLTQKFDKVYYAITGSELDGNRGILYRLHLAEDRSLKVEKEIDRIKWTVIGWGVGAGLLGGGVINTILSKILN